MVLPQVSKSENLQEVGRKIRHYREKKKMSQLELAEARDYEKACEGMDRTCGMCQI